MSLHRARVVARPSLRQIRDYLALFPAVRLLLLAHAGAELASYIEREDAYTVTFTVDGQSHRTTVRKDNLAVLVAGICLGGQDRRFDLQSLVGVIREAEQGRRLVRVGDAEGLNEEMYWRIHPPVDEKQ